MTYTYGLKAIPNFLKNAYVVTIRSFKFWSVYLKIVFYYIVLQFSYDLNKGKLIESHQKPFLGVNHEEISN